MAKYVWKGNNVAHFLKINEDAEPIPVGGKVELSKERVEQLRAAGHFFDEDKETPEPQQVTPPAPPEPPKR